MNPAPATHTVILDITDPYRAPALLSIVPDTHAAAWLAWWQTQARGRHDLVAEPVTDPVVLDGHLQDGLRLVRFWPDLQADLRRAAVDARRAMNGLEALDRDVRDAWWRQTPEHLSVLHALPLQFALLEAL